MQCTLDINIERSDETYHVKGSVQLTKVVDMVPENHDSTSVDSAQSADLATLLQRLLDAVVQPQPQPQPQPHPQPQPQERKLLRMNSFRKKHSA